MGGGGGGGGGGNNGCPRIKLMSNDPCNRLGTEESVIP